MIVRWVVGMTVMPFPTHGSRMRNSLSVARVGRCIGHKIEYSRVFHRILRAAYSNPLDADSKFLMIHLVTRMIKIVLTLVIAVRAPDSVVR